MSRTRSIVVVAALAASLAGAAAQDPTSHSSGASSSSSTASAPSTAPAPATTPTPTSNKYAFPGSIGPTTYKMYDPTESNIPSDGLVVITASANTTYTWTSYAGEAKTAVDAVSDRQFSKAIHARDAWNIAFLTLTGILGLSLVIIVRRHIGGVAKQAQLPFAITSHVRLNRALREERKALPATSSFVAQEGAQHKSSASSHNSKASTSSSRWGAATLAPFLPRASAAITTTSTSYLRLSAVVTQSTPPDLSRDWEELNRTRMEVVTNQLITILGFMVPIMIVWAYMIWVWVRVCRFKRRKGKKENALQSAS